jgi:hypothetical protein
VALYAKACLKKNKVIVILQTVCTLLTYGNLLINKIITVFTLDILLCCKHLVKVDVFHENWDPYFFMISWSWLNLQAITHFQHQIFWSLLLHECIKFLTLCLQNNLSNWGSASLIILSLHHTSTVCAHINRGRACCMDWQVWCSLTMRDYAPTLR